MNENETPSTSDQNLKALLKKFEPHPTLPSEQALLLSEQKIQRRLNFRAAPNFNFARMRGSLMAATSFVAAAVFAIVLKSAVVVPSPANQTALIEQSSDEDQDQNQELEVGEEWLDLLAMY